MDALVARQPIFAADLSVYGYELLFRANHESVRCDVEADQASATVIANASSLFSLETISGGKKTFVNVSRDSLLGDYVRMLPNDRTIVELPESVRRDDAVVEACRSLHDEGYSLALDDFVYDQSYEPLLDIADIVKIDILATPQAEWRAQMDRAARPSVRFLAEKVETQDAFDVARAAGFTLFQGFFFCKPVTLSTKDIPLSELGQLLILKEVNEPELDFDEIEDIIKREVSLAYKFLKYINSARFAWRMPIGSIRHGLTLLGERETRRWASVAAMACIADGKPEELVVQAVVRAKFCEGIAVEVGLTQRAEELFLMGLFSMLEPILDRELAAVMELLPVADDVKAALCGESNRLRDIQDYVLAYERGEWTELKHLSEAQAGKLYLNAVEWVEQGFRQSVPIVTPASMR